MDKNKTKKEIYLGVDYGERNIGLALGSNGLVTPLTVIDGKNKSQALSNILRIALENKVTKVVLGLPLTAQEKETSKSIEVRKFAKLLKVQTKLPVDYYNEFGTTYKAARYSIDEGISQKRRKTKDHIAAALILKGYFQEKT